MDVELSDMSQSLLDIEIQDLKTPKDKGIIFFFYIYYYIEFV